MKFFDTATPVTSEEVLKLIALGKGKNIVKAIENEKSKTSDDASAGEGTSGGVIVKRIGSVRVK